MTLTLLSIEVENKSSEPQQMPDDVRELIKQLLEIEQLQLNSELTQEYNEDVINQIQARLKRINRALEFITIK